MSKDKPDATGTDETKLQEQILSEMSEQLKAALDRIVQLEQGAPGVKESTEPINPDQFFNRHNAALRDQQTVNQEKVDALFDYYFRANNCGKWVYSLEWMIQKPIESFTMGSDKVESEETWHTVEFTSDQKLQKGKDQSQADYDQIIGQMWFNTTRFKCGELVEEHLTNSQPQYRGAKFKGENSEIVKPYKIATRSKEQLQEAFERFRDTGHFSGQESRTSRQIEVKA